MNVQSPQAPALLTMNIDQLRESFKMQMWVEQFKRIPTGLAYLNQPLIDDRSSKQKFHMNIDHMGAQATDLDT